MPAGAWPLGSGLIYVRGADSSIAKALAGIAPVIPVAREDRMPLDGVRYLFCVGLLRQKRRHEQTKEEQDDGFRVNLWQVTDECERLFSANDRARVCVIGSESAYRGSFDETYGMAKLRLHEYVERKALKAGQQLVCVSPSIVLNTGMTNARNAGGLAAMEDRRKRHPQRRWLQPMEVARMVHFLLCEDKGYTTNTVIRMHGGEY